MKLTLEVLETPDQFKQKVLNAICAHINPRVFTKISKLQEEVAKRLRNIIEASEGYKLLTSDAHTIGDFGFPQGDAKPYLDAIIDKICESITITFSPFLVATNRIRGSIKIGAVIADFSDVLSIPEAYISYYSRRFQGMVNLDWLSWLLEKGNKIIIRDFHIEYVGGAGRSGEALMRMSGSWRVDPQISGTLRDNWITRAVTDKATVEQELNLAVEEFFSRIV